MLGIPRLGVCWKSNVGQMRGHVAELLNDFRGLDVHVGVAIGVLQWQQMARTHTGHIAITPSIENQGGEWN